MYHQAGLHQSLAHHGLIQIVNVCRRHNHKQRNSQQRPREPRTKGKLRDMEIEPAKWRHYINTTYWLQNPWETIPKLHTTKYLGVKLQKDLKWNARVEATIANSSSSTIPWQSRQLEIKAYQQLVRPVLQYAGTVFDYPLHQGLTSIQYSDNLLERSTRFPTQAERAPQPCSANCNGSHSLVLLRTSHFRVVHIALNIEDHLAAPTTVYPTSTISATRSNTVTASRQITCDTTWYFGGALTLAVC